MSLPVGYNQKSGIVEPARISTVCSPIVMLYACVLLICFVLCGEQHKSYDDTVSFLPVQKLCFGDMTNSYLYVISNP